PRFRFADAPRFLTDRTPLRDRTRRPPPRDRLECRAVPRASLAARGLFGSAVRDGLLVGSTLPLPLRAGTRGAAAGSRGERPPLRPRSEALVLNVTGEHSRMPIVEHGELAELYIENPENVRTIGDIYLGRVRRILPGIKAAFVDIGQKQDAFLHFSD